jgi:tight adherence protein B
VYLPLLIFITVTLGVAATAQLLSGLLFRGASPLRRRMAEEFGQGRSAGPSGPLFTKLDQLSVDPMTGGMSDLGMAELAPPPTRNDWGLTFRLREMLEQANLRWTVGQLLALCAGLGLGLGALGTWLAGPVLGVPTALIGAATPLAGVHLRRRARQEQFLAQLPGAFELMARVLRSGHSVAQALQAVVESSEPPIAGDLADCQKQLNLGLRPEVSFQELARRSGLVEMRIFVMALLIQRQVGGNLSDVLERLAMLVRARLRLRDQVKALTAEGRLQGLTLLVLPFLIFGAMFVVNRSYALSLFEHVPLLVATGVAMLVGVLWIRQIVHFEA